MQIRWTPESVSNFEEIIEYISHENREAAKRTAERIFGHIEQLSKFPYRGRQGRESGTRELPLPPSPYIVVYRVKDSVIEVLRIWHGAQRH